MCIRDSSMIEGMKQREKEVEMTPKSVSSATNLYMPSIMRDFPEFHYDEMKSLSLIHIWTQECQGSHRRSSEGSGRGRKERKSEDFTDSRDGGEDRNSSCGNNSRDVYKRQALF